MKIQDFSTSHIEEAMSIALKSYLKEQSRAKALPVIDSVPNLRGFAENGLGVAAFEGGKMTGFLCCFSPHENAFGSTDVRGVFSPMGANAAVGENRERVFAAMYSAAAEKWVRAGAVSHGVCLYAGDEVLQRQMYYYGFGARCMDGISETHRFNFEPCEGFEFWEMSKEECHEVYPLDLALNRHFHNSPFFMNRTPDTQREFEQVCTSGESVFYGARKGGKLCAYLSVTSTGETFVSLGKEYRHIDGAYCLPEYRGSGIYKSLLCFVAEKLREQGYTRLGVDFESINPAAHGFWRKFFDVYTHSVVRRIDERILEVK